MLIDFRIIAHRGQRYDTCGDYFRKGGRVHFRVSRMKDRRYCLLVFIHELIEYLLCRAARVRMREIDRFDQEYEKARHAYHVTLASHDLNGCVYTGVVIHEHIGIAPCGCPLLDEPGDDPHAPYHKQHQVATTCEKLIAEALEMDWEAYGRAVEKL